MAKTVLVCLGENSRSVTFEGGANLMEEKKQLVKAIEVSFKDVLGGKAGEITVLKIKSEEWGGEFVDLQERCIPDRAVVKVSVEENESPTKVFLEDSSVSAIAYFFMKHKSIPRRIFWLCILIMSSILLGYVLYDRINELSEQPISTALTFYQDNDQDFPAVTFCSNDFIRRSRYNKMNLDFIGNLTFYDTNKECDEILKNKPSGFTEGYREWVLNGGYQLEDILDECTFMGYECDLSEIITTPSLTGLCHTFNSGKKGKVLKAQGTGFVTGLDLKFKFDRDESIGSFTVDFGVRVIIHPQGVPPRVEDEAISVGPGHSAYIGIRKIITVDESSFRNCSEEVEGWNYFAEFDYSYPACLEDCVFTSLSDKCNCNEFADFNTPDSSERKQLKNCTIDDYCCEQGIFIEASSRNPKDCNCPQPCKYDTYDTIISYGEFPDHRVTTPYLPKPTELAAYIYFRTLTVEQRITSDSYTWPALIADIGGQLGLFLGFTALTFIEILLWIFDIIKCFLMRYYYKKFIPDRSSLVEEDKLEMAVSLEAKSES